MLEHISTNTDLLPDNMLDAVKRHLRVEFTRDDDYIKEAIARAIAEVESATNLSINPSNWQLKIWEGECEPTWYHTNMTRLYKLPKSPVREVFSVDAAGAQTPVELRRHEHETFISDWNRAGTYLIKAGYNGADVVPPAIKNAIYMRVGTLYENRESVQAGTLHEMPDDALRLVTGLWRPSV